MIRKEKMPLAIGIAFVAFTTQFGGGFASGAQIYQYFINFGIWTLAMPFMAQGLLALFFWYGLRFAYANKTYDYRTFSDRFYGRYKNLFSNLYEAIYLLMICLAPAVAFATGGSTLNMLTGIPYIVCTLIIGIAIFIIAMYGTDVVRKAASTLSVFIIGALVIVLVPNIIAQWDKIVAAIANLQQGIMPAASAQDGSFLGALWRAVIYFVFQLASVGLMYQHVKPVTNEKQIDKSMVYMFIVNASCMMLAVLGLLAVAYEPAIQTASVPMLLLVQTGVGATFLTPLISLLIILGAVSTGVNMIAGLVARIVDAVERRDRDGNRSAANRMKRNTVTSLVVTSATFGIAQFGLIPLIAKGYAYLGYATLLVVGIPFIIHFIYNGMKPAQVAAVED
ncbi:YkvI family membrane protein [Anaerotalea alkaliphila]|uniref:Membrane protein YkvI n=1 Tax=Anaerotalea alkaliphila TaxID=2662126 RepID=A0A7X5KLT6_9FIRM|nr:hypothetical protein [Anaerotalea alkaliphila]NDL67039.1 hypothetical protein [Anaerotalea alkaliphila]